MQLSEKVLRDVHQRMVRMRLFDEAVAGLAADGRLPAPVDVYPGMEAIAAGVCTNLTDRDQITSTRRGHGHLVAKGGDLGRIMAELMGRSDGYGAGKSGAIHLADPEHGMLGTNGVVAGGIPIAVGAAFANWYDESERVAVAFFDQAATNAGGFHEAANLAASLRLPILLVCESDEPGYDERRSMVITDVVDRASGYGMQGLIVDGLDAVAIHEAAGAAIEDARYGGGPSLLECKTHGLGERDPIVALEEIMTDTGKIERNDVLAMWDEARREVEAAVRFAEHSPLPEPARLLQDVYVGRRQ